MTKKKLALICFFVGNLGVHRFMTGKTSSGALMLITLGGCSIWTLVDFARILKGKFTDKDGNFITE
tara:strand:+ start:55 stop:252 length:198 start_codon:yes stop_codon:yes gene_type:complete